MSGVHSPVAIRNDKKYYPSNVMNQVIVNAVTGTPYPYRVGTKDALRLYKVIDTTGQFSDSGKRKNAERLVEGQEKDPSHYYFNNVGEYMQSRSFERHPESCDEWSRYQKSLLDSNDKVDMARYSATRKIGKYQ